ncbi:tRNA pseudouridine synthase D [Gemmata obscuriglobus]|uniref:tRNA pseudouridine(13) synthase TruD n=1 Tax=Gemmata obscuriglobus TaxID=114 RepID=A0A2Z3GXG5_9BACT|nr:tRNA pseudouridine(13) synthase TruD [Gemmata obscuriglobus]AWM36702.1 tRNA pseudouridine(13) synthase TruD [Gemmata obscuriglobus]QEG30650.1 tRNA pseudouridine synthase D [Gemmata obscuriglobus]VTS09977.1 trna pseudouridine synthase d : tRNA pseudouridine synthase D OS=Planctomyces limnophilus (strain ATCC 43296 / DSM 3776 / IFAM 1008 / 290) GN=truD PE=3 SV=1: TruD [Gemmata obscuriglobus UQM 2246]
MKLKQQPQDFRVEERTDVVAGEAGDFALYRLDKTGWTTPDALAALRRRWQVDHRRLSYGGLKDRHAVTSQHLTIFRGPKRNLTHERVTVTYLGQCVEPFTAQEIRANRFTVTLRSLNAAGVSRAEATLREVADAGLPNYFDDQRFGSVGEQQEFVAKEMVFGRFERALWLALAAPYEHDRADAKREKATLTELWGKWPECQAKLPKGHARSLVSYLAAHPTDFKGAVARLRPELQGLYLSAYQSYLWNKMLAAWLTTTLGPANLTSVELKLGTVPAPVRLPDENRAAWESLMLPLPSARVKPEPDAPWLPTVEEMLKGEGLTLAELKVKGMQKPFFSKGDRPACVRPENLSHTADADELNKGRRKLVLSFDLPRGSYATMLVKRVTSP